MGCGLTPNQSPHAHKTQMEETLQDKARQRAYLLDRLACWMTDDELRSAIDAVEGIAAKFNETRERDLRETLTSDLYQRLIVVALQEYEKGDEYGTKEACMDLRRATDKADPTRVVELPGAIGRHVRFMREMNWSSFDNCEKLLQTIWPMYHEDEKTFASLRDWVTNAPDKGLHVSKRLERLVRARSKDVDGEVWRLRGSMAEVVNQVLGVKCVVTSVNENERVFFYVRDTNLNVRSEFVLPDGRRVVLDFA